MKSSCAVCHLMDIFQTIPLRLRIQLFVNEIHGNQRGNTFFLHGDAVQRLRRIHGSAPVGDDDELRVGGQFLKIPGKTHDVGAVSYTHLTLPTKLEV